MPSPASTLDFKTLGPRLAAGGTAEIFAVDAGRVLKLYWGGASPDAPEREAERARAAHGAGAPSPAVLNVLAAGDRFGVMFEHVQGPSMLEVMSQDPGRAPELIRVLARLHAELHALAGTGLPPQREHLSRRIALSPLNHRLRATVLAALSKLPGGDALCHGDFHPGNVLLADSGPSIIDWFDAVSGDPAADIARTLLLLQYSRAPSDGALESVRSELTALYLHEYHRLREVSSDALQAWALPVATARLAEPIAGQERTTLLRLIEGMLASQSQPPSAETAGGSGPL
jgi:aminoglycoside phosphotransferase (APT) family kinase protein